MAEGFDAINVTIDRGAHTVLVVDDNPATRYTTARVIRAAGFLTVDAATGGEALVLSRQQVSAVVLDVHLPDMNGFEVCRAIRSDPDTLRLPVVHLSAEHVQSEDRVEGLNAGADAYLVHPVEPAILVATLQALIRARMAELGLRRNELRFRTIYDQAPVAMALVDDAGCFVDVNPAMASLLSISRDELRGRGLVSFAPAETRERLSVALTDLAAANPEGWQIEVQLVGTEGRAIDVEWRMSSHVEPGLRIGMAEDISSRKELERRRQDLLEREQAARAAAEHHSRTKDDFVAVLSHELRTPLNAIAGWVHILARHADKPELARKGLDAIDRSVKAQSRIIADILDVSRLNSGKLRLHHEWATPSTLLSTSIEGLRRDMEARRLHLDVHQEPGAGELAWIDATRFQQVVWNLLTNAVKFSHEGGVVRVELSRQADRLQLVVQDEGQGIDPEFLPHLFDRFAQSDAPGNRRHGGLGLGLSIVRQIVELHEGEVRAESAGRGRGARFEAEIRATPPEPARAEPESKESTEVQPARLAGCNVLVIEDNVDASEMLMVVLTDAGADVRLATHAQEALNALAQRWPDVVVCDIGLPGMDGYQLMGEIQRLAIERDQAVPFSVAFTAFSRPQDKAKALEAGFNVHLAKPLQPHALIAAISTRNVGH